MRSTTSDTTSTTTLTASSGESSDAGPVSTGVATGPQDGSTSSASDETGVPCVEGTFVGQYTGDFELFHITDCETGELFSFYVDDPDTGGRLACRSAWVTVQGQLCGPSAYDPGGFYSYELTGDVIDGPCIASCGEQPAPEQCGTFAEVCAHPECGLSQQDCPPGDRCVPGSLQGVPPWTSTSCVPAGDDLQPIGAPCARTSPWHDDCVVGSYCAVLDDESQRCAALCLDDEDCGDGEQCRNCDVGDVGVMYESQIDVGVCGAEPNDC